MIRPRISGESMGREQLIETWPEPWTCKVRFTSQDSAEQQELNIVHPGLEFESGEGDRGVIVVKLPISIRDIQNNWEVDSKKK